MPRIGSRPGERRGGRQKGTPNQVTTRAREQFASFFARNLERAQELWEQVAAEDPKAALGLLFDAAEYHVPKLQRHEVSGEGGAPIIFRIEESK